MRINAAQLNILCALFLNANSQSSAGSESSESSSILSLADTFLVDLFNNSVIPIYNIVQSNKTTQSIVHIVLFLLIIAKFLSSILSLFSKPKRNVKVGGNNKQQQATPAELKEFTKELNTIREEIRTLHEKLSQTSTHSDNLGRSATTASTSNINSSNNNSEMIQQINKIKSSIIQKLQDNDHSIEKISQTKQRLIEMQIAIQKTSFEVQREKIASNNTSAINNSQISTGSNQVAPVPSQVNFKPVQQNNTPPPPPQQQQQPVANKNSPNLPPSGNSTQLTNAKLPSMPNNTSSTTNVNSSVPSQINNQPSNLKEEFPENFKNKQEVKLETKTAPPPSAPINRPAVPSNNSNNINNNLSQIPPPNTGNPPAKRTTAPPIPSAVNQVVQSKVGTIDLPAKQEVGGIKEEQQKDSTAFSIASTPLSQTDVLFSDSPDKSSSPNLINETNSNKIQSTEPKASTNPFANPTLGPPKNPAIPAQRLPPSTVPGRGVVQSAFPPEQPKN